MVLRVVVWAGILGMSGAARADECDAGGGDLSGTMTELSSDLTFPAGANDESVGVSVVTGDFNGDGELDLAMGAPRYSVSGSQHNGAVRIYFSVGDSFPAAPTDPVTTWSAATADVLIEGEPPDTSEEWLVGWGLSAGDLDGDGKDELVVGGAGWTNVHRVLYIVDGSAIAGATPPATLGLASSSVAPWKFGPTTQGHAFGRTVALADLNNDGDLDLLVGAPSRGLVGGYDGSVYGFLGPFTADRSIDPSDADVVLESTHTAAQLGKALATIGDVDGDGADDFAVGAPTETPPGGPSNAGVARVISGACFAAEADGGVSGPEGVDDDSACTLLYLAGGDAYGNSTPGFGHAVRGTPDVTGDGVPDLVVGYPGKKGTFSGTTGTGTYRTGAAYVYSGALRSPASAGAYYLRAIGVGSESRKNSWFGSALAPLVDVNGDGEVDWLVGGSRLRTGLSSGDHVGGAMIFHGPFSPGQTLIWSDRAAYLRESDEFSTTEDKGFDQRMLVADFDEDGYADVVTTAGNNSDYYTTGGVVRIWRGGENLRTTWYEDTDGDGYGDAGTTQFECEWEDGWASVPGPPPSSTASLGPVNFEVEIVSHLDGEAVTESMVEVDADVRVGAIAGEELERGLVLVQDLSGSAMGDAGDTNCGDQNGDGYYGHQARLPDRGRRGARHAWRGAGRLRLRRPLGVRVPRRRAWTWRLRPVHPVVRFAGCRPGCRRGARLRPGDEGSQAAAPRRLDAPL